jgi:hypothetical protein
MIEISRETAHSHLVNITALVLLMRRHVISSLLQYARKPRVLLLLSLLRKFTLEQGVRVRLFTQMVMSR